MLKPPINFTVPFSVRVRQPFAVTHYEVRDAHNAYLFELHDAKLANFVVKACSTVTSLADALQALDDCNWLDTTCTDHPELANAKEQARKALAGYKAPAQK